MKTYLNWKRGTFSTTYRIFSGENAIGQLQNQSFKKTALGSIHQKRYTFNTKGVFKQETQILDGDSHKLIGTITYGSMMTRATVRFSDRTVYWKYDNTWQTKWSLFNEKGILMKFSGRATSGTIECDDPDELLVLCGLFVTNYYQQAMIAVFVAVFIPVWVTLFN